KAGHLWLYSNEIDIQATPLKEIAPGTQVVVEAANGKGMGVAYVNPHSLICARMVSRDPQQGLDRSLLVHRLNQALALRQRLFDKPFYRLVHGEGDLLPGLIIDRFGDVVVVQLNTAGMQAVAEELLDALEKVLSPAAVVFRNDTSGRRQEGLEASVEVVKGELPDQVLLEENGVRFVAPVLDGQKTGWFYDHRGNRAWLNGLVAGKRVLDLFSYVGGWGVQAAASGASEVLCVDASGAALERVAENATLNGLHEQVAVGEGDAFEVLAALKAEGEEFDVVILDPPAFIRKRKDIPNGERAYGKLNREAMRLLGRDGLLLSASCSMHLAPERLVDVVRGAVRHQDRQGQILFQGHQGPDHPVHPAIPETAYLKALGVRVFRD
ncbi:MAG: class I SAM-dependent rRNA methyltransferase, partial [Halomonas sp.]|nr:class I SAM-dependent rRNA methyltransferase [Halomonas sp.]